MDTQTGFVGALLDFSFSEFITTKLIGTLYRLAFAWAIFSSFATFVTLFFQSGITAKLLAMVAAPMIFFVTLLVSRVFLELAAVVFRGVEYLREIRDLQLRGGAPLV